MTDHIPQPNEIYKHFKGNCYRIITIAQDSENGKNLVIYQALYGENKVYARELSMFCSLVDREKYPDAVQNRRFELLQQGAAAAPVIQQPDCEKQNVTSMQETVPAVDLAGDTDADKAADNGTMTIDPRVLQYLDAETYQDRLQILASMKGSLTDDMINTMAVAVDVEIKEGKIEDRYEELKYCLLTRERFECNRLR